MCYLYRETGITYDHFCQHFRDPGIGKCTQCQKQCLLHEDAGKRDDKVIEDIRKKADSGAGTSDSAEVTASTSGNSSAPQQAQARQNPTAPQQHHFNFGPNPIQHPFYDHQANHFAPPHGFYPGIPHPQLNQIPPPYPPMPQPLLNGTFLNPQPQLYGINPFHVGNQFPQNHQAFPGVVNNGGVIGNQANGAN